MADNGRLPGNHSARIQKKNIDFPPEVDTRRFVRMRVVCYQLIDQSINQAMRLFQAARPAKCRETDKNMHINMT